MYRAHHHVIDHRRDNTAEEVPGIGLQCTRRRQREDVEMLQSLEESWLSQVCDDTMLFRWSPRCHALVAGTMTVVEQYQGPVCVSSYVHLIGWRMRISTYARQRWVKARFAYTDGSRSRMRAFFFSPTNTYGVVFWGRASLFAFYNGAGTR